MQGQIKYQCEADPQWGRSMASHPGCERLYACTQCGNCSGTCPLSVYMDITPRRVIALVREGFRDEVLRSRTIWLCSCCYACAGDCPQKIGITDLMFTLKREAIERHLYPKRFPIPVLAHQFYRMVQRRGRSSEFWLMARMTLTSHPRDLFRVLRLTWQLFRTGRLSLRAQRIEHLTLFRQAVGGDKESP